MAATVWTPEALALLNDRFEHRSPREILKWGIEHFGQDLVMGTGFGPSGIVLSHLVATLSEPVTIFYLDTDLLFQETYALRDELAERLDLTFTRVHPDLLPHEQDTVYGPALWSRQPDQCCFLRKVLPLQRFLADKRAWVTGLRRDQARTRAQTPIFAWNESHQVVKINPLAHWTADDVWAYIEFHDLPYNKLHDMGYPSIGCWPCTAPVDAGEDERAGRWVGLPKTECGIHLPIS